MRVMGDDFVEKLRKRIKAATDSDDERSQELPMENINGEIEIPGDLSLTTRRKEIITTDEEREFFSFVKAICVNSGEAKEEELIGKDTTNYYNVSYLKPKKWFVRFFGDARRKYIATPITVDDVRTIAPNCASVIC